jgi:hypothetical protein
VRSPRASLALIAALLATACGKDDGERRAAKSAQKPAAAEPAPAPAADPRAAEQPASAAPSAEEQATAEKAAAALEELGAIAEGARGNCDKAAAAMKAVIDRNKAVLVAAGELGRDEAKEQWLSEKYGPRTDAAKSKLMPLMEKCAEHEGMATVFDSIE